MIIRGWHGWFFTINGVGLIAVAALPVAAGAVAALAYRRRVVGTGWAWRRSLAEIGLVYWTVPFVWLTLIPGARAFHVPGRVSLIPLRDLLVMGRYEIIGNLLMLAALGFFGPMRFTAMASLPRVLAVAAGCSALIETMQYVLRLDRVSSVDDVLVNTAGAGLAALLSRRWWRGPAMAPPGSGRRAAGGGGVPAGLQGVHAGVPATGGRQRVVGAGLHDPAVIEHDDPVGLAYRRQPVGDQHDGPAGGAQGQ